MKKILIFLVCINTTLAFKSEKKLSYESAISPSGAIKKAKARRRKKILLKKASIFLIPSVLLVAIIVINSDKTTTTTTNADTSPAKKSSSTSPDSFVFEHTQNTIIPPPVRVRKPARVKSSLPPLYPLSEEQSGIQVPTRRQPIASTIPLPPPLVQAEEEEIEVEDVSDEELKRRIKALLLRRDELEIITLPDGVEYAPEPPQDATEYMQMKKLEKMVVENPHFKKVGEEMEEQERIKEDLRRQEEKRIKEEEAEANAVFFEKRRISIEKRTLEVEASQERWNRDGEEQKAKKEKELNDKRVSLHARRFEVFKGLVRDQNQVGLKRFLLLSEDEIGILLPSKAKALNEENYKPLYCFNKLEEDNNDYLGFFMEEFLVLSNGILNLGKKDFRKQYIIEMVKLGACNHNLSTLEKTIDIGDVDIIAKVFKNIAYVNEEKYVIIVTALSYFEGKILELERLTSNDVLNCLETELEEKEDEIEDKRERRRKLDSDTYNEKRKKKQDALQRRINELLPLVRALKQQIESKSEQISRDKKIRGKLYDLKPLLYRIIVDGVSYKDQQYIFFNIALLSSLSPTDNSSMLEKQQRESVFLAYYSYNKVFLNLFEDEDQDVNKHFTTLLDYAYLNYGVGHAIFKELVKLGGVMKDVKILRKQARYDVFRLAMKLANEKLSKSIIALKNSPQNLLVIAIRENDVICFNHLLSIFKKSYLNVDIVTIINDGRANYSLDIAFYYRSYIIIKKLIRKGAILKNKELIRLDLPHDRTSYDIPIEKTILDMVRYSIEFGNHKLFKQLFEIGFDLNSRKGMNIYSLLHNCVKYNRPIELQILVNAGANLNIRNYRYDTPLHLAKREDNKQIINILEKGIIGQGVQFNNSFNMDSQPAQDDDSEDGAFGIRLEPQAEENSNNNTAKSRRRKKTHRRLNFD